MDDLNNLNNINHENGNTGELKGFDSVSNTETGYTVTPEGGFYTKPREEIIQDEVIKPDADASENKVQENTVPHSDSFRQDRSNTTNGYSNPYSSINYNNPYGFKPPKPKKEKKAKQKRYGAGVVITASVLAAVIGALSGVFAVVMTRNEPEAIIDRSDLSGNKVSINIDKTAENIVEAVATKVTPSVVGIRTTTSVMNFFGGTSEASGEGSGVVYTNNGYIITNYHVIADATTNKANSKIEVFLEQSNAEPYSATVVGYNISADLAVIKINVTGLTPIEIDDSDKLKIGQYVITVGNPGGLEFMDSVTYGVISGLNRVVSSNSGVELIQTDAAINPGNSGGALVNSKGKLVGINSAKIVSEEFEGMGFAIPSNTVVELCKKIIEKENSPEPYIGISISETYTKNVLKFYGYPAGAVVLSVADGSPADSAGIARGDIVTEFDGKEITEYPVLEQLMKDATPGETVEVKIYRSGRYYSTKIKIGSNNSVK